MRTPTSVSTSKSVDDSSDIWPAHDGIVTEEPIYVLVQYQETNGYCEEEMVTDL